MYFRNRTLAVKVNIMVFIFLLLFISNSYCAKIQFHPILSITGEYTDNFLQTKSNKNDEFLTKYGADLSFGIIDKKANLFLVYKPEYTDHNEYKFYDTWKHDVSLAASYQLSKNTSLTFSDEFVRDLNQSARTNNFETHDTNKTFLGIVHQFGKKDSFGINYTYNFDLYDEPNLDEFKTHKPSVFLGYWFSPKWGFDTNFSYSKTKYDISNNDPETLSGDVRVLHMINKHFDVYAKYAQSLTDQNSGDHDVYYPSLGFDWKPTDDSGITFGIGILLQNWAMPGDYDKERFFFELDMYKVFDFTKKSQLSITGESGYSDIDPEAASLGFNIYGQAGFRYTYQLLKKLSTNMKGSYRVNEYNQPGFDRTDNTLELGAGLVWTPLRWLSVNLSYSFSDFETDAVGRDDYQENKGILTIRLTPVQPVRFDNSNPRASLENQVFSPR